MEIRIADKDTLDKVARAVGVEGDNKIFGVRINKKDSNPMTRCEYLGDAVGKTPARMNFETGEFEYGDWADAWFIRDNFPCMVEESGAIAFKIDPNDYSVRENSTATSHIEESPSMQAMSAMPTVWLWQYEVGDYEYIYVANYKVNDNYHAYAHEREDGSIALYTYLSMFECGTVGGETVAKDNICSLSGKTPVVSTTIEEFLNRVTTEIGANWSLGTWSQRNLLMCLLVLISCSTDPDTCFGRGMRTLKTKDILPTGTLNTKGQFYGYKDNTHQVKVFHIEGLWGNTGKNTLGYLTVPEQIFKVKMTPPYNVTGEGYTHIVDVFLTMSNVGNSIGNLKNIKMTEYGFLPFDFTGSETTYYKHYNHTGHNANGIQPLSAGIRGLFDLSTSDVILSGGVDKEGSSPYYGAYLSYLPPKQ